MAEEHPDGDANGEIGSDMKKEASAKPEPNRKRATEAGSAREAAQASRAELDFSVPTLRHFASYSRVTRFAEGYIVEALRENRPLDHILVHGRPGSGTSTLARAIVRDYAPERAEELDAQTGISVQRMAAALRRMNRRGVLLVRHVELLDPASSHMLAGYLEGKKLSRRIGIDGAAGQTPPWQSEFDRAIARSAREASEPEDSAERDLIAPGGTVIATALLPQRLSYRLRNAFRQQIHLRSDPKALRSALMRVLWRVGVRIDTACFARVERVLSTLTDGTEPLARTILARAGLEGRDLIDDDLMRSIIEEDLPARLPDSQYAASLREHLAGRKVREASEAELERIDQETSWGRMATQAAIATMIREHQAQKRKEVITLPI